MTQKSSRSTHIMFDHIAGNHLVQNKTFINRLDEANQKNVDPTRFDEELARAAQIDEIADHLNLNFEEAKLIFDNIVSDQELSKAFMNHVVQKEVSSDQQLPSAPPLELELKPSAPNVTYKYNSELPHATLVQRVDVYNPHIPIVEAIEF